VFSKSDTNVRPRASAARHCRGQSARYIGARANHRCCGNAMFERCGETRGRGQHAASALLEAPTIVCLAGPGNYQPQRNNRCRSVVSCVLCTHRTGKNSADACSSSVRCNNFERMRQPVNRISTCSSQCVGMNDLCRSLLAMLIGAAAPALWRGPPPGKMVCAAPSLTVTCGSRQMSRQPPAPHRPMRSAILHDRSAATWIALLLFGLPAALFVIGKWCWIQCRIAVNCWRLGVTRAQFRVRWGNL
jgi:hypothetical protein